MEVGRLGGAGGVALEPDVEVLARDIANGWLRRILGLGFFGRLCVLQENVAVPHESLDGLAAGFVGLEEIDQELVALQDAVGLLDDGLAVELGPPDLAQSSLVLGRQAMEFEPHSALPRRFERWRLVGRSGLVGGPGTYRTGQTGRLHACQKFPFALDFGRRLAAVKIQAAAGQPQATGLLEQHRPVFADDAAGAGFAVEPDGVADDPGLAILDRHGVSGGDDRVLLVSEGVSLDLADGRDNEWSPGQDDEQRRGVGVGVGFGVFYLLWALLALPLRLFIRLSGLSVRVVEAEVVAPECWSSWRASTLPATLMRHRSLGSPSAAVVSAAGARRGRGRERGQRVFRLPAARPLSVAGDSCVASRTSRRYPQGT